MDIRPHRRLVIAFEPPFFCDLVAMSEFVSENYEHFGIAKFSPDLFSYTTVPVLRRMCDSLGLKLIIDCSGSSDRALSEKAASSYADYVVIPSSHAVFFAVPPCQILVRSGGPEDTAVASLHSSFGIACDSSFVAEAKTAAPADAFILSVSGDPVAAVKAGAAAVVVPSSVVIGPKPSEALRVISEEFREFT